MRNAMISIGFCLILGLFMIISFLTTDATTAYAGGCQSPTPPPCYSGSVNGTPRAVTNWQGCNQFAYAACIGCCNGCAAGSPNALNACKTSCSTSGQGRAANSALTIREQACLENVEPIEAMTALQ